MPRISEMPRPAPLTGLELLPALQGGGPGGNTGLPLLLTGAPFGGVALVVRAPMTADLSATSESDPGAGAVRWDNADPHLATELYVSDEDGDAEDMAAIFASLAVGGFLYIQGGASPVEDPGARNNFQKWQVTSIAAATGYTTVGVSLQASGGSFSEGDVLELTLQQPLPNPGVNRNTVTPLVSSSGVVTVDCSLGDYFVLAISEEVTGWVFQNVPPACSLMIRIVQDDPPRDVDWPVSFLWADGDPGVVSAAAGARDRLAITTDDSGVTWDATLARGFA